MTKRKGLDEAGTDAGTTAISVRTTQTRIAFLLEHAAVSQVSAATTASQIRFAPRQVPATDGNKLPPVLLSMQHMANLLDRLAKANLAPSNPDREQELKARIAALEGEVETLTTLLVDAEQAKAAAEALAKAEGTWAIFKKGAAGAAGIGAVAVLGIGAATTATYLLGADHPLIKAYLPVLGRLPN